MRGKKDWQSERDRERERGDDVVWRIHVCIRKRFKWRGRAEQQRRDQGREWELQADKEGTREREREGRRDQQYACLCLSPLGSP